MHCIIALVPALLQSKNQSSMLMFTIALQIFFAIGLMLHLLHEGCFHHLLVWLTCKPILQSCSLPTTLWNEGRWPFTPCFCKRHEASQSLCTYYYSLQQFLVSHSELLTWCLCLQLQEITLPCLTSLRRDQITVSLCNSHSAQIHPAPAGKDLLLRRSFISFPHVPAHFISQS